MLPRAAGRALNARGAPLAFRVCSPLTFSRTFAKDGGRTYGKDSNQGPVKNHSWPPDRLIKFAKSSEAPTTSNARQSSKADGKPSIEAATNPQSDAPTSDGHLAKSRRAADYTDAQPELDTSTQASVNQEEAPSNTSLNSPKSLPDLRQGIPSDYSIPPESPEQSKATEHTQKPLPDLRQGIPSSIPEDVSDVTSSFKPDDKTPTSLDLAEDPPRGGGSRGRDDMPKEAYVSSIERRRNRVARYMYISFLAFAITGTIILGRNWDSEEEEKANPDAPSGWSLMAFYERIKARLSRQMGFYTEPAFPKLLPTLDPSISRPYTLVLSLEDLLVHSEWSREHGWRLAKRPGVDYFLRYLSQYYELVIFTSVQMFNADPIIRKLDPYQIIMWPLFREGTRYMNGEHVKDLSYLNRDLSKVIIVDTVPGHVQLQPENAIILPKWRGDPKSVTKNDLVALIPFLEYVAGMNTDDVRKAIKSFEGKHIPTEFAARQSKAREAFNKKLKEQKGRRKWGGGLNSALGMKPGAGMMMPGQQSFEEALAQGKMPSDQVTEMGQRHYQMLEEQIRENGAKWLEEMEREQKKAQDEQMKAMQGGMAGMFGGVFAGKQEGSEGAEGAR